MSEAFRDRLVLAFAARGEWADWLAANAGTSPGIWLKFAKKASGVACVGKAEAIETALAHGWIDGQLQPHDERFWLVLFTPRGRRSKWSEINRATALRLIDQGDMMPRGLAEVDKAKADGRWDAAYAPQSRAAVPDDLKAALDAEPEAAAFFATLKGANRYAVLYRIHDAKTPETRRERVARFVAMLARGEVAHPPKG